MTECGKSTTSFLDLIQPKEDAESPISLNGLPISDYFLTESQISQNLLKPGWLLEKILFFARGIVSISNPSDLRPNLVSNTVFSGLVLLVREFVTMETGLRILSHPAVRHLRPAVIERCSLAEYSLEAHYAAQVLEGTMFLEDFPYYENYQLLMEFEAKCLKAYVGMATFRNIKTVAFIGSGPLPLSSIELLAHLSEGANIVNFDLCDEAIDLGQRIVAKNNLQDRIKFENADALEIRDLSTVDVVYLAALAGGSNFEKRKITEHLYTIMKPNAVLIARSAAGLRSFVYERLSSADFGKFQRFRHFDPGNKVVINSIAVGEKKGFEE